MLTKEEAIHQARAIAEPKLLYGTLDEIAKQADVTRQTLWNWLQDDLKKNPPVLPDEEGMTQEGQF